MLSKCIAYVFDKKLTELNNFSFGLLITADLLKGFFYKDVWVSESDFPVSQRVFKLTSFAKVS